jgi:hypothetical protein
MRIPLLSVLLSVVLSSCSTIREQVVVNASQPRTREVIVDEILSQGGLVTADSDYTINADVQTTGGGKIWGFGTQYIFNLSGSNPTRVVLVPYHAKGLQRNPIASIDTPVLEAAKETLRKIKSKAEGSIARYRNN